MKSPPIYALRLPLCLLMALLLAACGSDLSSPTENSAVVNNIEPAQSENFTLSLDSSAVNITEGQGMVDIPVFISRSEGSFSDITLTVDVPNQSDDAFLTRQFTDNVLSLNEESSSLQLDLAIAPQALMPHTRTLVVTATDAAGASAAANLTLQVQPTSAPDVYLLIGQSNMVGISEEDSRQAQFGGLDEPVENIRQLNVTFNDSTNFSSSGDFTDPARLFNTDNPLTIALDPLHEGLQSDGSKSGTRIGLGLSFAKRAALNTTADIFLVPAAWSDTGFCRRATNILPDIGWNATPKTNAALSGTLLHDRAIARANIALDQTGGVLRGIIWHQGEADSDDPACAQVYEANLIELVQSLRTNINIDGRGAAARGQGADIPFVVGTMSKAGDQAPFSDTKLLVDATHRNIAQLLPFANVVNNDDLVPTSFPCGGGSCIHFGAAALREMGARYYEQLLGTMQ